VGIRQELDRLYDNCRSLNPGEHFVPCGVVNEEAYQASYPKLVYILREPNDPDHNPRWRIDEFLARQVEKGLAGQSIYPMWQVVGAWTYAIHNGLPRYGDISKPQVAAQGLRCVGMTNLKKSGGGGTSNYREIRESAAKSVSLWKAELEVMRPDMVVCCGTFRIVTGLLGLRIGQTKAGPRHSVWRHEVGDSLLLQMYHPASRFRKDMLYAFLKEALVELREKGLWRG